MNSFILKKYDDLTLDLQDINLDEQQEHIRLHLLEKLGELFDYKDFICPGDPNNMFPDEFMHVVTTILTDRCVTINNNVPIICIHVRIRELGIYKTRISNNEETFIDVMCFFIINNLQCNGIFTETWCEPEAFIFTHLGNALDYYGVLNFLYTNNDNNDNSVRINEAEVAVTDYLFEAARDDKIDELYNPVNDHEIIYKDEIIEFPEDEPRECGLCGEKCKYACEKCKYMLCDECITNIRVRSGECPACRTYPLVLKKISEGIETIDENFYEGYEDERSKDVTQEEHYETAQEKHLEDDHMNETQEKHSETAQENISEQYSEDDKQEKHSETAQENDQNEDASVPDIYYDILSYADDEDDDSQHVEIAINYQCPVQ